MPARVAFFSAPSEAAPSACAARRVPAVTSSQRQRIVPSATAAMSKGGAAKMPPECRLEIERPAQRRPRRRILRRGEAEVARRRQPGQPAAGERDAGAADRRAVADGEDAGQRGAAVLVGHRLQPAQPIIREAVRGAERPGQAGLRLEAEVQGAGIRRDA